MESIIIDTPEGIDRYRILALKGSLKLECVGMKRRGRSAYSMVKEEFGFKGNKKKVLEQLEKMIAELPPLQGGKE